MCFCSFLPGFEKLGDYIILNLASLCRFSIFIFLYLPDEFYQYSVIVPVYMPFPKNRGNYDFSKIVDSKLLDDDTLFVFSSHFARSKLCHWYQCMCASTVQQKIVLL